MNQHFAAHTPRLIIERVTPALDAGRYPIKRLVGDEVRVEADIFKDGHDLISARLLYRHADESAWREAPFEYSFDPDRWSSSFRVDRVGRWQYTVEAWPALYRTWIGDLKKRLDVGQDVTAELAEGAALVTRAAAHLSGTTQKKARAAAAKIADAKRDLDARLAVALSDELIELIPGPIDPESATRYELVLEVLVDRELGSIGAWYELFPRSQAEKPGAHGTFADVERRLPDLAALGFDVLYLPPIHPIGHTHRKGRNNSPVAAAGDVGSPWAIGSEEGGFTAVHPALGTLDDFTALVGAAREFGLEIALDYALQCSPDHPWVRQHPEWFFIRPDGSVRYAENPPKKYEDIYPLNFWCADRQGLWNACRDVIVFWIECGVRVFRVDNPHTKPFAFWEWLLADVRERHPDAIFLAEAFTRPKRMRALAKLGFTQSYSYFTWKNTAAELTEYLTELTTSEMAEYYRPNLFANTPDILHEYLQTGGRPAFRVRLLLAATLSPAYGIYSGFELCENTPLHTGSEEYLHSEKYEIRVRDWSAPRNIKQDVSRLNRIRRENAALRSFTNLHFLDAESEHFLAYQKSVPGNHLIIVANLDPRNAQETMLHVQLDELGVGEDEAFDVEDLWNGGRYVWRGRRNYVRLDPTEKVGHVFRVTKRRP
jgi:starch synthase (maltosyl-transferring)